MVGYSVYSIVGMTDIKLKREGYTQDTYKAYDTVNQMFVEIVRLTDGRTFIDYGVDKIEILDQYRN